MTDEKPENEETEHDKTEHKEDEHEETEIESEEEKNTDVSRRTFIKNTGIATGGVVGGAVLGGFLTNVFQPENTKTITKTEPAEEKEIIDYSETRQFFKRKEDFDVLSIATERIYPEDDNGPGAIELGVPYFIDKQLAGMWGGSLEEYRQKPYAKDEQTPLNRRDVFLQGVRKINQVSKSEYDGNFYDLEESQQIEVLEKFESDEVKMDHVSSAAFFGLLRQSTMEGCFSDPMYGGNKNMDGWRMKEYPGPRIAHIDRVEEEEFISLDPVSLKTQ